MWGRRPGGSLRRSRMRPEVLVGLARGGAAHQSGCVTHVDEAGPEAVERGFDEPWRDPLGWKLRLFLSSIVLSFVIGLAACLAVVAYALAVWGVVAASAWMVARGRAWWGGRVAVAGPVDGDAVCATGGARDTAV